MKVSLNWLSEHLDFSDHSIEELDDLLTFAGVEVEGIEPKGVPSEKVVVAQIKEAVQHPDAEKLKVCQVDAGEESLRQIVCGAKNYKVGDKVPCALPGADLGGGFVIQEGKLRGVASRGMLCGASEIGFIDEEDGLMILDASAEIGKPLVEMFDSDTIIEVEVTPNRPDLLSHRGMARELAALTGKARKAIEIPAMEKAEAGDFIQVQQPERCPLYSAIKISGVKVVESPAWLKTKLEAIGLKPQNCVVDATNYVLHELGHPLHAFDAAKVSGNLEIRLAGEQEAFVALDEEEYTLSADDLVISDESGTVLALAGIMGGKQSGVSEQTVDVILEAAYFTPAEIRRSSRQLILSSDSSYRFERGTDAQAVLDSAAFCANLIVQLAGGEISSDILTAGEAPVLTKAVELDVKKLEQLMGENISLSEAEGILTKLGLEKDEQQHKEKDQNQIWQVPSYRLDLERHIDLVEEIARVHGLDKVQPTFRGTFVEASSEDATYDYQLALKRQLAALGFYETQTMKLIAKQANDTLIAQMKDALPQRPLMEGDLIEVALPLSEDHSVMRPSLVPGLVAVAARNVRQGAKGLRFFEIGKQFRNAGGGKAKDLEAESLALLMAGQTAPLNWANKEPRLADLYDLKAVLASLVPNAAVQIHPRDREGFILAGDVLANGKPIGVLAQLSPTRCRELDIDAPVYVAELDVKKLQQLSGQMKQVDALPSFPGSSRDAAMEAPLSLSNADIQKAITKHNESLLVDYHCFDVFTDPTGEKLAKDKKSVAYSFTYRSADKTLKAKEVDSAHQKLLAHLEKALKVSFR